MSNSIGVINEQGFVAGDFGFKPISEEESEKIKAIEDKKSSVKNESANK